MSTEPQLIVTVNNCLLFKLNRNFDEIEDKDCYSRYQSNLVRNVERVLCLINDSALVFSSNALASVFILYNELLTSGPWSSQNCNKYAFKLNEHFETILNISISNLLSESKENVDKQEVFDTCMMKLHLKLTSEDFKRYPAQIEVYCRLIANLKEYQVNPDSLNIIPISLILVDDFVLGNKLNGLKSLFIILQLMKPEDFKNGNYYEVIYGTLKKSLPEKDVEVSKLVLQCFLKLLLVLPSHIKENKHNDVFASFLDEILMESNLYRKAMFFQYTKEIIKIIGVTCVKKKKKLINIFCDNLDICANEEVAKILLSDTLECIKVWISHSWCAWNFKTDKPLLAVLMTSFVTSNDQKYTTIIEKILVTLTKLCTPQVQALIINDYQDLVQIMQNQYKKDTDIKKIDDLLVKLKKIQKQS